MGSVLTGVSVVLVGALLLVLGVLSSLRKLPMNSIAGLRFPSTMVDDATWRYAHHKAAGWLILSGVGMLVAGTVTIAVDDTTGAWVMGGTGWMLLMILIASYIATRAAKHLTAQELAENPHQSSRTTD